MPELMENPVYGKFIKRNVTLPVNVQSGMPWMIMARRTPEAEGSPWARKLMPDYKASYFKMKELLSDSDFSDVSIISRRMLFAPPLGFVWPVKKYPWCGRCRRPTVFQYALKHPALNGAPVLSYEDPWRCLYCGMRQISMPRYSITKLNKEPHDD
jgi:hypothetical protein